MVEKSKCLSVVSVFMSLLALASAFDPAWGKGITIANKGTSNPVLLYHGNPIMLMGSVSETGLFAFAWDSSEPVVVDKTHSQWAEWQKTNGMGYARAYPESGFTWWEIG